MFSKLRHFAAPAKELQQLVQQTCAKATAASPAEQSFYKGDQKEMTVHLVNAHYQDNPELSYHDVSRGDHDFSSCDYLALAEHQGLNDIEADFVRKHGRITFNRSAAYPRNAKSLVSVLEDRCAEWLGASKTLMTNSGTESNVNVLQVLLSGTNWPLYIDKYAHATFVFGARAAGRNDYKHFKHNNVDELLKLIKEGGPGIVCIDTVYSALGTIAPIDEIVDICKQHGCILIADEAHAIGTFGKEGEGLIKMKGLEKEVPFRTTSLGKSFGGGGGLVIFNEQAAEGKEYIGYLSSMPVFSLAPQESLAVRLLGALDIVKKDNWRREELDAKTEYFRQGALKRGYQGLYVQHSKTNIIPFVVGNVVFAKTVYDKFVGKHIYPSPHFYPASPRNKSVVRFTVCNINSYESIDYVLDFMEEIKDEIKPSEWPDNHTDVFDMGFQKV